MFLNRGAREGELTETVRDLVACAVRGEKVSAVDYTASGAAYRREPIGAAGTDELARKDARSEEARHFEFQNIALRSQVEELRRPWARARALRKSSTRSR